ncbi:PspC domain-containing protein [Patescibacteria group bacterium]|nr:PspC domain-containing protein [Patescibacteria group bacterium]
MKKTTTISLARTLFHIEEDAYALLDTYLISVKSHFADHDDKEEILSDIEARIAERFTEARDSIIDSTAVQAVIDAMGTIGQFDATDTVEPVTATHTTLHKRLYRDADSRVVAGVAAGLAHYFGIDRTIVRIIFIGLVFLSGFGIITYIVLWMVTPLAKTNAQKLEMAGVPVTLKAMSEIVRERFEEIDGDRIAKSTKDFAAGFSADVERGSKTFFATVGPLVKVIVGVFVVFFALCATAGVTILTALGLFGLPARFFGVSATSVLHGLQYSGAVVALYLAIVLPIIVVLLWGISLLRKKSILNRINVLVFGSLWFLAVVVSGVMVSRLAYKVSEQMKQDPMIITQTISQTLSPFVAVDVADGKNVTIVMGQEYKIEYEGTQSAIQDTAATVQDGILSIRGKDTSFTRCMFCDNQPLHMTVTLPLLSALIATDNARIYGDVQTQSLKVTQSDSSQISLTGSSGSLDLNIKDSSAFDGQELMLQSARVVARDGSTVSLDVKGILVAEAYDGSSIEYTGTSQAKIIKKDGSRVEAIESEETVL